MKKLIRFLLKTLLWACRFITFPLFFPFFLGFFCITIIVQGLLNLNEWANDRDYYWDFSFPLFVLFAFACLNFELVEEYC